MHRSMSRSDAYSNTLGTTALALVLFLPSCTGSVLDEVPTVDFPSVTTSTSVPVTLPVATTAPPTTVIATHVVQQGETLGQIAGRYDTNIGSLVDANDLSDPNDVRAGDLLVVAVARAVADGEFRHTVAAGENLGIIASEYEVSASEIAAANGIDNPNSIGLGSELIIPARADAPPESRPGHQGQTGAICVRSTS